jgi:hypothetical protein
VDLVSADVLGRRDELALRWSSAHGEPAAALSDGGVEIGQRLEQELRSRTGREAAVQEPVVEAEDRHHSIVATHGRPQRRVIVDAEVASEPDERGHRGSTRCRDAGISTVA